MNKFKEICGDLETLYNEIIEPAFSEFRLDILVANTEKYMKFARLLEDYKYLAELSEDIIWEKYEEEIIEDGG